MIEATLAGTSLAITGVDGFVGRHVARLAAAAGASVHGISRSLQIDDELTQQLASYSTADLRSGWPLTSRVDAVIHLAGLAAVGPSFRSPQRYINDNSAMVTTMCEALLKQGTDTRVVGVSSGALYAAPEDSRPLTEDAATASSSPYAVSKLLVEHQLDYYNQRGLQTVITRPFNHIGPGQRRGFLLPDLMKRLRELPIGAALIAGNLSTARDYTDVRDIARAYLLLASAQSLPHRLYNVATSHALTGNELLQELCAALGREVPETSVDPAFLRPTDVMRITGSAARLRADFGWEPKFSLARTVRDTVSEDDPV